MESANDTSNVLRALEGKYTRDMSLLKGNNSNFSPEEAVKILLRTHFPNHLECLGLGQPEPDLVKDCLYKGAVGLDLGTEDFIEYINTEKVRNAMRSFGSRKAPGCWVLNQLFSKISMRKAVILTSLYKMSIRTQQIPSSWRKMDVIFKPKPGKEDYSISKILQAHNTLVLCSEGIGEDHVVVPERKSLLQKHWYLSMLTQGGS